MKRSFSFLALFTLALAACGPTPSTPPPGITEIMPLPNTAVPSPTPADWHDASLSTEQRVDALLAQMTLDEKIGQMTQVEKGSLKSGDITRYALGSVLSGGGGAPNNYNTPAGWAKMVEGFQQEALATRLGIPLIYGVDAVHGHGNLQDATLFPHNIGLGAANDPALVERIGRATAEEMLATGIPWDFAPVVAVPQDIRWGRTYEGYSESTEIVTALGTAYLRGLQTLPENYAAAPGQTLFTLATPKHFIGDGGTVWGSSRTGSYQLDQGNLQVDEATLRARYLPPYRAAVDAGALSIMASFSSWKGTKLHAQKVLLTDLLKGELGFQGFIVSDWQAIDQIDPDYYKSVVIAINAGVDMNMVPYDYVPFIDAMKQAVSIGDIPLERVDDAVRRILRAKFALGLFEHPMPDTSALAATVRSPEHLTLAREAVQKSLVLLKNENAALPISPIAPVIFVAGEAADDLGVQSGGWTLEWQGVTGNRLAGTTILSAIQQTASANTTVEFNRFGQFDAFTDAQGQPLMADVSIVVIGEPPYAEGVGDKADVSLGDPALLERVKAQSKKVVLVILSGRPVVITPLLSYADAVVAAWWPGTEGQGAADVLFGAVEFSGKLPYTWPRSSAQLPLNINNLQGRAGCDGPLFPLGYGLTTRDTSPTWPDCP